MVLHPTDLEARVLAALRAVYGERPPITSTSERAVVGRLVVHLDRASALKQRSRRVDTDPVKQLPNPVPCPGCGTPTAVFDRRCPRCEIRTSWTLSDRWQATPASVRAGAVFQWFDALAAGCGALYFAVAGGRGLLVTAPWRTNAHARDGLLVLGFLSIVGLVFAVLAGTVAWLAYGCGSGLLRRRRTAWSLSVSWLCLAGVVVIATSQRLDVLVLVVICVQVGTLLTPGARLHLLHSTGSSREQPWASSG
jgi:hypothetical protein